MGKLFELVDKVWELLVLNLFWILYIFRGFIFLGFFPSTAAVYGVVRHWMIHGEDSKISVLFKRYYKENFKYGNLFGWMLTALSLIVYLNWYVVPSLGSPVIKTVIYGLIVPFTIFILLMWIYLFPVLVQFNLKWVPYLMLMLKISITFFSYTLLQAVMIMIYGILFANFTILMAIFGVVFIALIQMYVCSHVFEKMKLNGSLQT